MASRRLYFSPCPPLPFARLRLLYPPARAQFTLSRARHPRHPPIASSLINCGLWLLGWLPGVIHALVVTNTNTRLNSCTQELALPVAPGAAVFGSAERSLASAFPGAAPAGAPRPGVAVGGALTKEGAAGLPSSPADPKEA